MLESKRELIYSLYLGCQDLYKAWAHAKEAATSFQRILACMEALENPKKYWEQIAKVIIL